MFDPKYGRGDLAIYSPQGANEPWLMEIYGSEIKRCIGDFLPHRYYHGKLFALRQGTTGLVVDFSEGPDARARTTKIINVPARDISDICTSTLDLH